MPSKKDLFSFLDIKVWDVGDKARGNSCGELLVGYVKRVLMNDHPVYFGIPLERGDSLGEAYTVCTEIEGVKIYIFGGDNVDGGFVKQIISTFDLID